MCTASTPRHMCFVYATPWQKKVRSLSGPPWCLPFLLENTYKQTHDIFGHGAKGLETLIKITLSLFILNNYLSLFILKNYYNIKVSNGLVDQVSIVIIYLARDLYLLSLSWDEPLLNPYYILWYIMVNLIIINRLIINASVIRVTGPFSEASTS